VQMDLESLISFLVMREIKLNFERASLSVESIDSFTSFLFLRFFFYYFDRPSAIRFVLSGDFQKLTTEERRGLLHVRHHLTKQIF